MYFKSLPSLGTNYSFRIGPHSSKYQNRILPKLNEFQFSKYTSA